MGNKIASIDMITDNNELAGIVIYTTDSGIEIVTTHQNRYTGKFTTYTGSGIRNIAKINVTQQFVSPKEDIIIDP